MGFQPSFQIGRPRVNNSRPPGYLEANNNYRQQSTGPDRAVDAFDNRQSHAGPFSIGSYLTGLVIYVGALNIHC